jgi:hypothetical protein
MAFTNLCLRTIGVTLLLGLGAAHPTRAAPLGFDAGQLSNIQAFQARTYPQKAGTDRARNPDGGDVDADGVDSWDWAWTSGRINDPDSDSIVTRGIHAAAALGIPPGISMPTKHALAANKIVEHPRMTLCHNT